MRALFKREERKALLGKIYAVSKRAASIVLIAITVLFGGLLTDAQVQATIRETLIRWHDGFTLFRFQGDDEMVGSTEWFPAYIPSGFEVEEMIDFSDGRYIVFVRLDGEIIIFHYHPAVDAVTGVDNEYTEMEIMLLNGTEYFVISPLPGSEHSTQVIWQKYGYAFHLLSGLPSETLLQVALSVSVSAQ
jgi:hypothetical protein